MKNKIIFGPIPDDPQDKMQPLPNLKIYSAVQMFFENAAKMHHRFWAR